MHTCWTGLEENVEQKVEFHPALSHLETQYYGQQAEMTYIF